MAKPKADPYDADGFAGAHQARGLSEKARERLASKGLLPETEVKPKPRATSSKKKVDRRQAEPKATGESSELPRRSRKARALQARHFRLPMDIDDKLKDLVEHYDSTMVWVVCKLIQEDWVRTRREQRKRTPETPAEQPPDAPTTADPASSTKGS